MASLRFEDDRGRQGWRLQFRDVEKRNRTIWLGNVPEWNAQQVKQHVEHLLDRVKKGQPPEMVTADWLGTLDKDFRNKLAKCGLCETVEKRVARVLTMAAWLDEYFAERTDIKPGTLKTYEKTRDNLVTHFGRRRLLRDITPTDAKKWRTWLKSHGNRRDKKQGRTSMAEDTVRRRTGMAKQFFDEAVERGIIESNPFDKLPTTTGGNSARQFFVTHQAIEKCIEQCPDVDWRTILALARYGGLRCPSELLRLRWCDVNLPEGRMVIHASKTEHHADGGVRVCPIFVELRPYLEAAEAAAPDGTEYVINRYRSAAQNLRTQFEKIIKRAGLVPWPRLFQNLRASRETELMGMYPSKDVASWLGNTVTVAMKHYAMETEAAFKAASDPNAKRSGSVHREDTANGGCTGGCIPGISDAIGATADATAKGDLDGDSRVFIVQDSAGHYYLMGDTGFEPVTYAV
ncbi:phage integrase family protein [Rhodopirellula maiorica SM1]|uniref:Phage integrase family protein n=2 Tax=Novipirellula TaxID=2795426 RepID=M5RE82_9BACT|nr:phage integrase family protein [Rhodopirellula maiorica SM1]